MFETHIEVGDMARSLDFYQRVCGLTLATQVPARNLAFLWIGGQGHAMLGLWGSEQKNITRRHFAFQTPLQRVLAAPKKLRALGQQPRGFGNQPIDEAEVFGWMPAAMVYFDDPDGHSLELICMLDDAARPDLGVVMWSQWIHRAHESPV